MNDTYGHHTGDLLLIGVSARMMDIAGDKGTCIRLGGDEFIILFSDTEPLKMAKKLENN
ncbi:diguanylate cyclase domain-containing protein [Metabacillus sp. RGM 3146]|uniref:diguanylate cyclase domain-containing protein n=1 Tax=Metabacillus sp. RGM 3146 TaxID=3401092 RepID=UPI003B9BA901